MGAVPRLRAFETLAMSNVDAVEDEGMTTSVKGRAALGWTRLPPEYGTLATSTPLIHVIAQGQPHPHPLSSNSLYTAASPDAYYASLYRTG